MIRCAPELLAESQILAEFLDRLRLIDINAENSKYLANGAIC